MSYGCQNDTLGYVSADKTIEITATAAMDLIPCLEGTLTHLTNRYAELSAELLRLKAEKESVASTLMELRTKLQVATVPSKANGHERQRLPKGHGERLVFDLLKSIPDGDGLTMTDIVVRSGVGLSTVRRTLLQKNKGRFVEAEGRWKAKRI